MHGQQNFKIRNFLTMRDFVTLKDGTDRLSRNVGNNIPIYAV
jgi:hypothetical protein